MRSVFSPDRLRSLGGLFFVCALVSGVWACDGDGPDDPPDTPLALAPEVRFALADAFGFEGSPTLCDLDHNGRLELVAPVAAATFPGEIRVVDAVSGTLVWRNTDNHAAYGYPLCTDVDGDGTEDVLVAGRGSDVWVMSGVDGTTMFRLGAANPGAFPAYVNEVGSVASDRVTGATLFVALRGNRGTATPGAVVAFDRQGVTLARWDEPDAKEIYDSPAVVRVDDHTVRVVIGSGGETAGGMLRVIEFDEVANAFTLVASVPSACTSGGFVASPALADLDGDGVAEIAAADFCGRGVIVDVFGAVRHTVEVPGMYATANPTFIDGPGRVARDVVFTFASVNPSIAETVDIERSTLVAIDGQTGAERFRTTIATQALATPSSLELTGDDVTDLLVVGMDFRLTNETGPGPLTAGMFVLDGATGAVRATYPYGNGASTPIVADVDADDIPDVFVFDALLDGQEPRALMRLELVGTTFDEARTTTGFRGYPHHDGMR